MPRASSRAIRLGVILLTSTAALAQNAHAAEFITLEDECHGRQLMIRGPIGSGDHERFVAALARLVTADDLPAVQDPDTLWTVRLDSPGGDPSEAMKIGQFLRDALATTEVSYRFERRPDGVYDFARTDETICLDGDSRLAGCAPDVAEAECAGACVLIWLGGARRRAIEGRLGLAGLPAGPEAERYIDDMIREPTQVALQGDLQGDLQGNVKQEVQPDLLTLAGRPDPWLDWPERDGLSTDAPELTARLEGCPAALTSEQAMESLMTSSAARRDALLTQAEAHHACRMNRVSEARAPLLRQLARRHGG